MKKITIIAASIVAAALTIAAPFAFAQHRAMQQQPGLFGGQRLFRHLDHAQKALGLTDGQVAQLKTIFGDLRTQNAPYRESLRDGVRSAVQTLLANPNDVAAAQAIVDQQTAAERTMKMNALSAASKALNVLTPEQRAKLGTFVQERMARRAGR